MKECPKCKAEMEDDALFCGECGTKFDIADTEPHAGEDPIIEEKYCIHCGKAMEADSLYCPHCGKPQEVEEAKPEAPKEQKKEEGPQQDDEPTYELEEEKKSKTWLWGVFVIAGIVLGAWWYWERDNLIQASEVEIEKNNELEATIEKQKELDEVKSFIEDFYLHYKEDGYIYSKVSESVIRKLKRDNPYYCDEGDCLATWIFAAYPEGTDMKLEVGPLITVTNRYYADVVFKYSYDANGEKKYEERSIRLFVEKKNGKYLISGYIYDAKTKAPRHDQDMRISEIREGEYRLSFGSMYMTLIVHDGIVEGKYYFHSGSSLSTTTLLRGSVNGLKLHLKQTCEVNGDDMGSMDGTFDGKTFKGEYDKDGMRHSFEVYVGGE